MAVQSSPVLIVADPEEGDSIRDLLSDAGFDNIGLGDGGEGTLRVFEEVSPDVVVVAVGLALGDAQHLVSSMRARPAASHLRVVLIGEIDGPIRNALDASDYEVDRFVGRPLSSKALAFAVSSCAAAVREARGDESTAPPPVSSVVEKAIDAFVRDAIDAIEHTISIPTPADHGGGQAPVDAWDAPSLPVREPTYILSDGGAEAAPAIPAIPATPAAPAAVLAASAAASAAPDPVVPETTEPQTTRPWDEVGPLSDEDDLAELGGRVDAIDDLDDQLAELATGDGETSSPPPDVSGGNFARQLRKKMSAMAERLFPTDGEADREAFDAGAGHGHRTEIDFASFDGPGVAQEDLVVGDSEPARAAGGTSPLHDSADARVVDLDAQTTNRAHTTDIRRQGDLGPGADGVASIIARQYGDELTGRVTLKNGDTEKEIYFDKGRPVFATSNLTRDRMGDLLYREGKITFEQHAKSREVVAESGRRMGEILIEMGFLKRRELLPAVRRHIEDIIYSVFAWRTGEYTVGTGASASSEKIRLSRHPAAIVMEGIRRKYDAERLEQAVGTQSAVVAITSDEVLKVIMGSADLSPTERSALRCFDGEQTLEQLAGATGIEILLAYQLAYGLVVLGAAEIRRRGDDRDAEIDSVRAPELVGETDLTIDRQRVLAKWALVNDADYFTLLGVRRNASSFEIKRAFESALRDYATDSFPSAVQLELGAEIAEINELLREAYHVLKAQQLRCAYLTNLHD